MTTKVAKYIMGDYNIDLLDDKHSFINHIVSYIFIPTITKPTRVSNNSFSLIDNIITNTLSPGGHNRMNCESGILLTDLTDHFPVFLNINSTRCVQLQDCVVTRNYSQENIDLFLSQVSKTNWDHVLRDQDANSSFNMFFRTFSDLYEKCFPMARRKMYHKIKGKPWISSGILKSIKTNFIKLLLHFEIH